MPDYFLSSCVFIMAFGLGLVIGLLLMFPNSSKSISQVGKTATTLIMDEYEVYLLADKDLSYEQKQKRLELCNAWRKYLKTLEGGKDGN